MLRLGKAISRSLLSWGSQSRDHVTKSDRVFTRQSDLGRPNDNNVSGFTELLQTLCTIAKKVTKICHVRGLIMRLQTVAKGIYQVGFSKQNITWSMVSKYTSASRKQARKECCPTKYVCIFCMCVPLLQFHSMPLLSLRSKICLQDC